MDNFSVRDKVVLVTGGTRGLGRAISLQLASQGAQIIAGYFQNETAAESFMSEVETRAYRCAAVRANLMTSTGLQTLVDHITMEHGHLDAFIHNAATGVHKPLKELTQRHLSIVWQVNVAAFFELALKLRPLMGKGSRIVAISSEGAFKAVERYGSVGSSKAALGALCRQMAAEWAVDGISVNAVAPGLLETDTLSVWEDAEERVEAESDASPLRRLVRLEEVAHLVHFLCSPASEGIVGQTIVIDGGKCVSSLPAISS
ncbi:MAG: SDR family oxidoreductase [Acidobacteria bacterium]|nr:SDR family oxidoreductase [Acidobacteriota bacterium]MCI0621727.1 SDR family oxidoreductase [Acidobacteriota bacterium]MCI0718385.1 SDR family oxidoreductase [Acidobacteriota bacterium]